MARPHARLLWVVLASLGGCTMPNPAFDERDALADDTEGEGPTGDGDGEPPTGDGDGEPPTGDGDGEPPTGDGDGEPPTGDGDGEPPTGDGDGDEPIVCDPGIETCGDACVDTDWDNRHCGGCNNVCDSDELCGFGICNRKRHVFVSTHRFSGAGAASNEATSKCTALAQAAGLPGVYRGWISDQAQVPGLDFAEDPSVFLRTDGWALAWSWADMLSGALAEPINLDEWGEPIEPSPVDCGGDLSLSYAVWTGTTNTGLPTEFNCNGWSVDTMTSAGTVGDAQSSELWSESGCLASCGNELPVYCIED